MRDYDYVPDWAIIVEPKNKSHENSWKESIFAQ